MIQIIIAITIALFVYTDNIAQKLADLYKNYSEGKVDKANESIGALKKEIILNACFILVLFVTEKIIGGLPTDKYLIAIAGCSIEGRQIGISSRMTLFILALLVFIDQGKAFITANEYRHIISKSASK